MNARGINCKNEFKGSIDNFFVRGAVFIFLPIASLLALGANNDRKTVV